MDKIPISIFSEGIGNDTYTCGTLVITKAEYANAEKINDLIEWNRELQERILKLEGK